MAGSVQKEKSELGHVLASGLFGKAPRQATLLKYICEAYFEGRVDQIKEYTLATEVLGRPPDFDPNRDAIVRVEIHRLRKKLKEYYEEEGSTRPVEIIIDPGQYVPRFALREKAPPPDVEAKPEPATNRPVPDQPPTEPTAPETVVNTATPHRPPFRVSLVVGGGIVIVALVLVFILRFAVHPAARARASSGPSTTLAPASAARPLEGVRILCGYRRDKYIDRAGNVWTGDQYFSGGQTSSQAVEFLPRAPDVTLYESFRFGDFSYDIPLQPGNYELHLYFLETHYGIGSPSGGGETSRMFDVLVNDKPILKLFDIIKDAGGDNNVADERVFSNISPAADGRVHIQFKRQRDSPILSALAVLPAPPGKIIPIRILAQNNSYTDRAGDIWSPDRYYRGGQLALHVRHAPVSGTAEPGLYSSERFGNFTYAIPVPAGRYQVTLRFAETYWGLQSTYPNLPDQHGSPVGGAGSRIFDVYCNGTTLLKNFDIIKEAGGPLIARDKTFHNLQPDAQGKLLFSFVPVVDYAFVNAIEVETEPE